MVTKVENVQMEVRDKTHFLQLNLVSAGGLNGLSFSCESKAISEDE